VAGSGPRRCCTAALLGLAAAASPIGCTTTTVDFVVTDGGTHDLPGDGGDATAVPLDGLDAGDGDGSIGDSFDGGGVDGLAGDDAAGNDGVDLDGSVGEASALD